MNPFDHHGIAHLSPSSLNLFIQQPGIWALQYLARRKSDGAPSMWRGSAVETGYIAYLRSFDAERSVELALRDYVARGGKATDDEAKLIGPMFNQCCKWETPSKLNAAQIEIEHWFDGIPVRIKGYVDLAFDGVDVDLKTSANCPKAPRNADVRQVALYRAARKRPGALLYVTAIKHAYYEVTDAMMAGGLQEFEDAAHKVAKLLGTFDKPEDILSILPVDWDHYRAPKRTDARTAASASDFEAAN